MNKPSGHKPATNDALTTNLWTALEQALPDVLSKSGTVGHYDLSVEYTSPYKVALLKPDGYCQFTLAFVNVGDLNQMLAIEADTRSLASLLLWELIDWIESQTNKQVRVQSFVTAYTPSYSVLNARVLF